jgi:hypothetical protein
MSKTKSIIFEGKQHSVVRAKVENRIDPPKPNHRDYPLPAPPPDVAKLMEKRGDHKAVRAWLEKQSKPYQYAVAEREKKWAGKTRFFTVISVDLLAYRWRGNFMGMPGGEKFSVADLRGAEILPDGALRLANGKGIHGRVEELTADEIRDNREILSARDGGVAHSVAAVATSAEPRKRGRPRRDHDADSKIRKRWQDARAEKAISIEAFLQENPDIFRGMAMPKRLREMRCLLNAAGKRQ